MKKNILVSVAWPYASGSRHLGHIGGAYLPADIFARYHRAIGNAVLMVSGSDAHGTPITVRADEEGVQPLEIVNKYHSEFLDYWDKLDISWDNYTTTMTDTHREVVHDIFLKLHEKGLIYKKTTKQAYDPKENRYLPDRYVEGTCPKTECGAEGARGDQCDICGSTLDPDELINPVSKISGSPAEFRDTEHFFLKLSSLAEDLIPWLEAKNDWRPHVINWSKSFVTEGLIARAITRDLEWGIDIPLDDLGDDKKIYVWFEAVLGYLTATVELFSKTENPDQWKDFWEKEDSESYYFQGKDNIPFHTIILPAILLGIGGINLPTDVVANEYLNFAGREFSKSSNWAVWLPDFLEKYSPDSLRYYLTSIMPETSDSDFTWEGYVASNNNELVATLGNFIHRVLTMSHRNFDGEVPYFDTNSSSTKEIIEKSEKALEEVGEAISKRKFRESLNKLMNLARFGNQYLDKHEPWKKIKEDKKSAGEVLGQSMIIISAISSMLEPFLPNSAEKLQKVIFNDKKNNWNLILPISGDKFDKPTPLFEKLEEEKVLEENGMISDE